MNSNTRRLGALMALGVAALLVGCERPPTATVQSGYRGTGMVDVQNPRTVAALHQANTVPDPIPAAESGGPSAGTQFKNVKVLNDLSVAEFTRVMVAITNWVAPKEGCAYCHKGADLADDSLYTKVVARQMLQMTRHINAKWKNHVGDTGVTCYTCHRGNPVPAFVWHNDPGARMAQGFAGGLGQQNRPGTQVGLTAMPQDPFGPFLVKDSGIRVIAHEALPGAEPGKSIPQTEWTYSLMMHMSESLGVNCTYCHNSRSFAEWSASSPPRATAWYGIRMVRDLNAAHLEPLAPVFPAEQKGPLGDGPKLNCATCHQGVNKPLYGAPMAKDYPELGGSRAAAEKTSDAGSGALPASQRTNIATK
jgi:photosynthetic reaction center cytochrome c subunit